MQIGSPKGATASNRTLHPGKHPISSNFKDIILSENDFIIPVSPFLSWDTVLAGITPLFRLNILKLQITQSQSVFQTMGCILPKNISYVIENPDRFIITLSVYVVLLQHEVLRKK